jgi:EpsI family protein
VVAIVANGIRAYAIIVVGHLSDMRWGASHSVPGYIWFGFVLMALVLVGRRYADIGGTVTGSEHGQSDTLKIGSAWPCIVMSAAAISVVFLMPYSGAALAHRLENRPVQAFPELPELGEPWNRESAFETDWHPDYFGSERETVARYSGGDSAMDVYLISYGDQHQGAEIVNEFNRPYDPDAWRELTHSTGTLKIDSGRTLRYRSLGLKTTPASSIQSTRTLWYWYLVDGRSAVSPFGVKLREALSLFSAEKSISSVIIVSAKSGTDATGSQKLLEEFIITFCDADAKPESSPCGE